MCGLITLATNQQQRQESNSKKGLEWSEPKSILGCFGCETHAHIPNARRTIENKSCMCVQHGMTDESNGYRCLQICSLLPYDYMAVLKMSVAKHKEIIHKEELEIKLDRRGHEHDADINDEEGKVDSEASDAVRDSRDKSCKS
ncbi:hypothetical protein MTR_4g117830 [Medicago truncatula]|uniref:Uncharacterized protein n=1 Tax=Medicago truncatula TaxID=3880 RepID=A0A072V2A9_MEDTR|nr:hypothetical protein MTR_4g117830 [Medicago truncatula]